ncbi:MAG: hypothetical protein KIT84_23360 [Labilithrix sp.]|nr:hypothetical protein [Labilithrix sp.]MCW5813986.1 hypothetical protein [Labilithrix sp.]
MISALRDKYERMRALREAHARADEPDPRPALQRLAAEFPGALRELDRLPIDEIAHRILALRAAEADPARIEGWMIAEHTFHRYARGVLATKRWLSDHVPDEAAFRRALPTLDPEAALFATDLEAVASPPRGRVMDLVYARAADDLCIPEPALRHLLHDQRIQAPQPPH